MPNRRLGLLPITNLKNHEYEAHVVFVHGLMGHPIKTWYPNENDLKPEYLKQKYQNTDIESKDFWDKNLPELEFWLNWLGQYRSDLKIWTYGYDADFRQTGNNRSLSIRETAKIFTQRIINKKLPEKPIIFIAYSLGGILVKLMLDNANNFNPKIIEIPKGIAFLATPHSTPSLVKFIDNFENLPITREIIKIADTIISPADYVNALKNDQDILTTVNDFYRNQYNSLNTITKAFYETDPMNGLMIVSKDEANPGLPGVDAFAIANTNHQTIAKPKTWDENDFLQETILALIDEVLDKFNKENQTSGQEEPRNFSDTNVTSIEDKRKKKIS